MTVYCVKPGGGGVSGLTWVDAFTTITAALAAATSPGDIIQVDASYAGTVTSALTWTPATTRLAIICVTSTGVLAAYTGWATTATETCGTTSGAFNLTGVDGCSLFVYGITIFGSVSNAGTSDIFLLNTAGVSTRLHMKACNLTLKSVNAGAQITLGVGAAATARGCKMIFEDCGFNCTVTHSANLINIQQADIEMINPSFTLTATKPATLFQWTSVSGGNKGSLVIRDGDITGFNAASSALFSVASFLNGSVLLKNCVYSSNASIETGSWPAMSTGSITIRNSDSGDTINTFEYRDALGILQEIVNTIYANDGATFNSVHIAWWVQTRPACNEWNPFVLPSLFVFNTFTSSQTVKVETLIDGTLLRTSEMWIDADYPASSSLPNYTNDDTRAAEPYLTNGSAGTTGDATWTVDGTVGTQGIQKMPITFTAAEVGLMEVRISVALASITELYIDPQVRLSGVSMGPAVDFLDNGAITLPAASAGGGGGPLIDGGRLVA